MAKPASDINPAWKLHDAFETYGVKNWGKGYFGINKQGHVTVHPDKNPDRAIDLKDLVDQLRTRGIQLPILLRFTDILRHRIGEIADAFEKAIDRVRLHRRLPLRLPDQGEPAAARRRGDPRLRQGRTTSAWKPAASRNCWPCWRSPTAATRRSSATASRTTSSSRWWCSPQKIGKNIIPVVEKFTELELIVKYVEELGVRQPIGVRVKLASRGAGRWRGSAGYRSKFGLTLTEVLEAFEYLKSKGLGDCLQLTHFHLGSQITEHPQGEERARPRRPASTSSCTASGRG